MSYRDDLHQNRDYPDVVSEGMEVKVKVLEIDQRGKVRLSMRVVDQETGEELEDTRPPREAREPRAGGDRGGDRGPRDSGPAGLPDFLKD
jgi:polyribonucleotide nucleotidyltransferase